MNRISLRRVLLLSVVALLLVVGTASSAFAAVSRYQETAPSIVYSTPWTPASGADNGGWTCVYSDAAGEYATFTFTGTGVDWIAAKSTAQHVGEVFLDGVSQGTVDLVSPIRVGNQLVWSKRGLSNTTHTLRIVNVTPYVNIDAFDVFTPSTISASAGTGGGITPSGSVQVEHLADQVFAIVPDEGYEIEDVVVDGVSQGAVASYTFLDVIEPHTISATFSAAPVVSTSAASVWSLALVSLSALGILVLVRRRNQSTN